MTSRFGAKGITSNYKGCDAIFKRYSLINQISKPIQNLMIVIQHISGLLEGNKNSRLTRI